MTLAGRQVIVTGGSRGIGLGIATRFAESGASLVLVGRHESTLRSAIATLPGDASSHRYHAIDLALPDRRSAWAALLSNCSPAVLVNCAGVTHYSLLARTPHDTIDSVIRTNLTATVEACKYVSAAMLKSTRSNSPSFSSTAAEENGGGAGHSIINIASALAHRGGSGSSVYAASKAGVIGFTKALAQELGPRGIRVNAVAPGYVETDMTSGMSLDFRQKVIDKTAVGRIGTVAEIADAVHFLATNQFANGTCLTIDGGLTYE